MVAQQLFDADPTLDMVLVDFPFSRSWQEGVRERLSALYTPLGDHLKVVVDHTTKLEPLIQELQQELEQKHPAGTGAETILSDFALQCGCALIDPRNPLRLNPLKIPKPWGQEIWFTGIESRGVCDVVTDTGITPLDWILACASLSVMGCIAADPVLLKILDPHPDDELGDLYFELHEEKREVYIVTHVDEIAWPGGKGAIRLGLSQEKLQSYPDEKAFREAYAATIHCYEKARRDIDAVLDQLRRNHGLELNTPLGPKQTRLWLSEVPVALLEAEKEARKEMNDFTRLLSLEVGDVVKVPCYTPHALQHGVRTVEFQTPVYERMILSFGQKVLTQPHWDTNAAIAAMQLVPPATEDTLILRQTDQCRVEKIVDFDDFEVLRIIICPGGQFQPDSSSSYSLLMAVSGSVSVENQTLEPEQAMLLPAGWGERVMSNKMECNSVALMALPKAH